MFHFIKKKETDFPPLTETSLARIRHIATLPPPISNDIFLKKDMEEWNYSKYMCDHLKEYFKQIDEEKRMKQVEKELVRLREIETARTIAQKQEEQQKMIALAERKRETKETFEEVQEILKEIRDAD